MTTRRAVVIKNRVPEFWIVYNQESMSVAVIRHWLIIQVYLILSVKIITARRVLFFTYKFWFFKLLASLIISTCQYTKINQINFTKYRFLKMMTARRLVVIKNPLPSQWWKLKLNSKKRCCVSTLSNLSHIKSSYKLQEIWEKV